MNSYSKLYGAREIFRLQEQASENYRKLRKFAEKVYRETGKRPKIPRPEPCMTCTFIAVCKYEALVCPEFRAYANQVVYKDKVQIPDMHWDEYQQKEIENEEREAKKRGGYL